MELKPGYKLTEVGVIPEDWEVSTATDVCELVVDCKNRTPPIVSDSDYAVVRTSNVRDGQFVIEDLRFTDEASYREWTARAVPQFGDIMITREAPLGEVCAVPPERKVCLGQRMMLYRPLPSKTDSTYLLFSLMSLPVKANLLKKIGGSTVGHAKVDDIRFLQIPVPPTVAEQRAIAEALSDVDALLGGLDRLIAKQRDLKHATMQQLLTGQTRLPGFTGEWEVKRLGEVVEFLDGRRRPIKDSDRAKIQGDIPYFGASGIVDYVNDYLFDEDLILLGEDGENILSRNSRLAFKISGKTWVNNHAHVLSAKPFMHIDYLVEFLESRDYEQYNTGTAQPKLNKAVCSDLPVMCPSLAEQTAIAAVLTDMDAELAALEARRAKTRLLKQAMMQELLTGKTRLT